MNKIFDRFTKKNIAISTALKRGIAKNPSRFEIPKGMVLIPDGKTKRMVTTRAANKLFKANLLNLNKIIGTFDFNEFKSIITKPKIKKKEIKKIKELSEDTPVIRYVLTQSDKRDSYALYNFLKNNNIRGKGSFIVSQNGRVIFDIDLDIDGPLSKWWKDNNGFYIGMVNSDQHIWIYSDESIYMTENVGGKKVKVLQEGITADKKGKRFSTRQTPWELKLINGKKTYVKKFGDRKRINKLIQENKKTNTIFYWSPLQNVEADIIYQTFRDNNTNTCFFDVIEKYIDNQISNLSSKSKSAIKKYKSMENKVKKWKKKYVDGVSQIDIQNICDDLTINFEINDVFNNNFLTYKSKRAPRTTLKYMNTRLHHVDENNFVDNQTITIEIDDMAMMKKILHEKINNEEQHYYTGTIHEPNCIYTQEGTYKYVCEMNDIINKFNSDIDIYDYKMDFVNDNKKCEFILKGVNYNSHCRFKNLYKKYTMEQDENGLYICNTLKIDTDNLVEYDLKSAYSQYKQCEQYIEFPTHMTPEIKLEKWNVKKCKKYVGYYKVIVKSIDNDNVKKILEEIGFIVGKVYVLPSPEILLMDKYNVKFNFISGSYCFKTFDFDLDDDMFTKIKTVKMGKEIIQKPYCIWAGKLNSNFKTKTLKTYCCNDMSKILASKYEKTYINKWYNSVYDDGVNKIIDNNLDKDMVECQIQFDKKKISWLGHIGGYITSYTRCIVLDALLQIPHDKILGFKLDGFVIDGNVENIDNDIKKRENDGDNTLWAIKPTKLNFGWGEYIYSHLEENEINTYDKYDKDIFKNRVTLLSGAGGTGKSHFILENMKDTLYLSACWRLNTEKMKDYNIKGMSYHQFLGLKCQSYLTMYAAPARIFIDEITQIDKSHIKKIINKCPYSQIFLAGDVEKNAFYQCAFKGVNVINSFGKIKIIKFTHNYRCKDDKLLKKLNKLRDVMKSTDFDNYEILKHVKKSFKENITTEQHLIDTYDYKNDWVLCSTTSDKCRKPAQTDYNNEWVLCRTTSDKYKDIPQTKYYTDLLKGEKYICVKHTKHNIYNKLNGHNESLKGEVEFDLLKNNKRFEKRHGFTIHGFQGITIKNPNRLFIDTNKIFSPRQLYTALSRVEYLSQIYLLT